MSRRSRSSLLLVSLIGVLTPLAAPVAALAAVSPTDDADAIAQAIMVSAPQLTGAAWQQRPVNIASSAIATDFGTQPASAAFPSDGDTFAILSSGHSWAADDAGGAFGVSGSGWGSDRGDSHDVTVLRLDINVPSTANCLSLDFSFLSEEWPDYVNDYNDAFIAELDTSDWTASATTVTAPHNFAFDGDGDVVTINSRGLTAVSAAEAAGTVYNGATRRLSASTPITPGAHAIHLSISDNGDTSLDSAAFVDNLRIGRVADPETGCAAGARSAPPDFQRQRETPPSATGPEGSVLRTSGRFDAGSLVALQLAISPNPGTFESHGDGTWSWSMFADDDLRLDAITVSAAGGLGFGASASFDAIATNVAPTVTLSDANDTEVDEGSAHTFGYAITDPGADTITSVVTSCGPGTKVAGSDAHTNTGGSLRCDFPDGPRAALVTVQATDDDAGVSAEASQLVSVSNVAPSVTFESSAAAFDEGPDQRTFTYTISDPGRDSITSVATDCGDGGRRVDGSAQHTNSGGSFACTFADGPAAPVVTATATDSDGATGAADRQTVVVHDPPIVAEGADLAGVETTDLSPTVATFSDPTPYATAEEYAASIDWGDGSQRSDGTIRKTDAGHFTVTGAHAYARFGRYDVSVRIADADNPTNDATARSAATISDAPIHATGIPAVTPRAFSGAVATFSDDATPDGAADEFSATIDWGDGSPRSTGTVSRPAAGRDLRVWGSHVYASAGRFAPSVVVTSAGASTDTATASFVVYAFATASGDTFAISDAKAQVGSHATFWGSTWQAANPFVSGVAYGGAFRGYVEAPANPPPSCGDTWLGRTGGGADVPATVPPYLAVVVANGIEKSGSTVGGTVVRIAVVQTDPGYGSSGTGKVVADVCATSGAPSAPPRRRRGS